MNIGGTEVDAVTAYVADGDISTTVPIPAQHRIVAIARGISPCLLPFKGANSFTVDPDDGLGKPSKVSYPIVLLVVHDATTRHWVAMKQSASDDLYAQIVSEWALMTSEGSA